MHELSLIANLFEILEKNAEENKAQKITYVKMQVGLLSGAVPELLKTAFDIYKKDTIAAEAEIEIIKVPLKVECGDCGQITTHDDYIIVCGSCGSSNLKTLAGTDMILEKMELEIDSPS
ncbi:MAG: hydrogenase maturation nickel metallochaperone HypA [Candidatus Aminicenantes bacterium]|nr:hydrogenase maturation nickel metallochaperone HypA [Candidatus Aminicenantes bacterium]